MTDNRQGEEEYLDFMCGQYREEEDSGDYEYDYDSNEDEYYSRSNDSDSSDSTDYYETW